MKVEEYCWRKVKLFDFRFESCFLLKKELSPMNFIYKINRTIFVQNYYSYWKWEYFHVENNPNLISIPFHSSFIANRYFYSANNSCFCEILILLYIMNVRKQRTLSKTSNQYIIFTNRFLNRRTNNESTITQNIILIIFNFWIDNLTFHWYLLNHNSWSHFISK